MNSARSRESARSKEQLSAPAQTSVYHFDDVGRDYVAQTVLNVLRLPELVHLPRDGGEARGSSA